MAQEFERVLTFEIERDGDTAVVKCHGRLVAGTSEELYQEVKDLLAQKKVVKTQCIGPEAGMRVQAASPW